MSVEEMTVAVPLKASEIRRITSLLVNDDQRDLRSHLERWAERAEENDAWWERMKQLHAKNTKKD